MKLGDEEGHAGEELQDTSNAMDIDIQTTNETVESSKSSEKKEKKETKKSKKDKKVEEEKTTEKDNERVTNTYPEPETNGSTIDEAASYSQQQQPWPQGKQARFIVFVGMILAPCSYSISCKPLLTYIISRKPPLHCNRRRYEKPLRQEPTGISPTSYWES